MRRWRAHDVAAGEVLGEFEASDGWATVIARTIWPTHRAVWLEEVAPALPPLQQLVAGWVASGGVVGVG